jgi:hypothetical protein
VAKWWAYLFLRPAVFGLKVDETTDVCGLPQFEERLRIDLSVVPGPFIDNLNDGDVVKVGI